MGFGSLGCCVFFLFLRFDSAFSGVEATTDLDNLLNILQSLSALRVSHCVRSQIRAGIASHLPNRFCHLLANMLRDGMNLF